MRIKLQDKLKDKEKEKEIAKEKEKDKEKEKAEEKTKTKSKDKKKKDYSSRHADYTTKTREKAIQIMASRQPEMIEKGNELTIGVSALHRTDDGKVEVSEINFTKKNHPLYRCKEDVPLSPEYLLRDKVDESSTEWKELQPKLSLLNEKTGQKWRVATTKSGNIAAYLNLKHDVSHSNRRMQERTAQKFVEAFDLDDAFLACYAEDSKKTAFVVIMPKFEQMTLADIEARINNLEYAWVRQSATNPISLIPIVVSHLSDTDMRKAVLGKFKEHDPQRKIKKSIEKREVPEPIKEIIKDKLEIMPFEDHSADQRLDISSVSLLVEILKDFFVKYEIKFFCIHQVESMKYLAPILVSALKMNEEADKDFAIEQILVIKAEPKILESIYKFCLWAADLQILTGIKWHLETAGKTGYILKAELDKETSQKLSGLLKEIKHPLLKIIPEKDGSCVIAISLTFQVAGIFSACVAVEQSQIDSLKEMLSQALMKFRMADANKEGVEKDVTDKTKTDKDDEDDDSHSLQLGA